MGIFNSIITTLKDSEAAEKISEVFKRTKEATKDEAAKVEEFKRGAKKTAKKVAKKVLVEKREIPIKKTATQSLFGPVASQAAEHLITKGRGFEEPKARGGVLGITNRLAGPGAVARFSMRIGLEAGGAPRSTVLTPQTESEKALIGEEAITPLSESITSKGAEKIALKLGIDKNTARKLGFGPAVATGLFFENPFFGGGGKAGKEGVEQTTKFFAKEAEKLWGKEITSKILKNKGPEALVDTVTAQLKENINKGIGSVPSLLKVRPQKNQLYQKAVDDMVNFMKEKPKSFLNAAMDSPEIHPNIKRFLAAGNTMSYKTVTNQETMDAAGEWIEKEGLDKALDFINKSQRVDEQYMARGLLAIEKMQEAGRHKDAAEVIKELDRAGRQSGRAIQALSILSRQSPEGMTRFLLNEIEEYNQSLSFIDTKILKRKPVQLNENELVFIKEKMMQAQKAGSDELKMKYTQEAMEMVNQKMPAKASELFHSYRYQNMLSSPTTQLRNIHTILVNTLITRPAVIGTEAVQDWIGASLSRTPKKRERYLKEVPAYYRGVANSTVSAIKAMREVWSGNKVIENPDLKQLRQNVLPGALTVTARGLEAFDQGFRALLSGGLYAAEKAKGTPDKIAKTIAEEGATKSVLRAVADPKNRSEQGYLLSKIDEITVFLSQTKRKKNWVGTTADLTVPFLTTLMNFGKAFIENSPAGFLNIGASKVARVMGKEGPGAIKSKEALARATVGSMIMGQGFSMALDDRTTWEPPKNPLERQLWYASGRKPYSIRVEGTDTWLPMIYLGPFAMAVAIPAAYKYYNEDAPTALTDSQMEKIGDTLIGQAGFLANQLPFSQIETVSKLMGGNFDYTIPGSLGFTAGQIIPLQGMVRYVNKIINPVYKKAGGDGIRGFWEGMTKDVPYLNKDLPVYNTPDGEPSRRDMINLLLPWDMGRNNDKWEKVLKEKRRTNQIRNIYTQASREQEARAERFYDNKIMGAPRTDRIEILNNLAKSDPELFSAVTEHANGFKNANEILVDIYKNLGVKDGSRAAAITDKVIRLEDPAAQSAFLNIMLQEKIIRGDVKKQLNAHFERIGLGIKLD